MTILAGALRLFLATIAIVPAGRLRPVQPVRDLDEEGTFVRTISGAR